MNRKENTPKKMNHGPNMQLEKAKEVLQGKMP